MIEITYHKEGDYFIPNLYLAKEEYKKDYQIGKYGYLRLQYLKEHKKTEYTIMLMDNTLRKHIIDTDIRKGQILRSTPNTAPLICGACNTQPEGLLTTA